MNFSASSALHDRALKVIPLGTQTLSKSVSQFVQGATPIYIGRGKGAHLWDIDGNQFIDYPMALGPMLLGYADDRVDNAIRSQLDDGITFTLNHPIEVEVAEKITALCPGVDAVRFGKTGSDAVSAAVRAARAFTGRDRVVACGYHGWHDWYIGSTTRDAGIPAAVSDLTTAIPFNDLPAVDAVLSEHPEQIAAIVIEPSGATVPAPGYLEGLIDRAHTHGTLVVFDEIIVGFRVAPGGARQRYGVQPDLSCYGKAMGNGMPVSAVGGAWDIMSVFEEIFFSGTHGGEALSLAAASAVLDTVADGSVLQQIEDLGRVMLDGCSDLIQRHGIDGLVTADGEPQRTVIGFGGDDPLLVKSLVQQRFAEAGILFNGSMFISASHSTADVEHALATFDGVFAEIAAGGNLADLLVGAPVSPVFRAP